MLRRKSPQRLLAMLLAALSPGLAQAQDAVRSTGLPASPAPMSEFGLRGATNLARASLDPVTGPILPADPVVAAARSAATRRSGRSLVRSSRKPTAAVVRPPVHAATVAPQTTGTIQEPVLGDRKSVV